MRTIVLSLCVCAAACSGQNPDAPTSPAAASSASPVRAVTELPFQGSYVNSTAGQTNCPPTCPPTTLQITGTADGHATHLGQFSATFTETVDIATATGTAVYTFTAANGDRLFANLAGGEDRFEPPNISHVTMTGAIAGGTGRFAGATGTLTIRSIGAIDFAAQTSTGTGTLDGRITLER